MPLLNTPTKYLILLKSRERGSAPLLPALPLPLIREGGQGDRFLNNLNLLVLKEEKPTPKNIPKNP